MYAPELDSNCEAGFLNAIGNSGLSPPKSIVADGGIHRFASDGSPHDDAGWYVAYFGAVSYGTFGCFRLGIKIKWLAQSSSALSVAEKAELRRHMVLARKTREEAIA